MFTNHMPELGGWPALLFLWLVGGCRKSKLVKVKSYNWGIGKVESAPESGYNIYDYESSGPEVSEWTLAGTGTPCSTEILYDKNLRKSTMVYNKKLKIFLTRSKKKIWLYVNYKCKQSMQAKYFTYPNFASIWANIRKFKTSESMSDICQVHFSGLRLLGPSSQSNWSGVSQVI